MPHGADLLRCLERVRSAQNTEESTSCTLSIKIEPDTRGLVPGIHVFLVRRKASRGWPGHRRAAATPSFGRLCPAMTEQLQSDLHIHLQQVSVGIPEEQRAMAERLVGRRFEQVDTAPHQLVGTAIDVIHSDLESELQRSAAGRRRGIL